MESWGFCVGPSLTRKGIILKFYIFYHLRMTENEMRLGKRLENKDSWINETNW